MIGVYGGTFDPVHFGHLRTALEVQQQLHLHEVRMFPCNIPPHRKPPIASAQQRRDMLASALSGQDNLVLDERELHRAGPSYTVDTLKSLRAEPVDRPLVLIMGMDAFQGLEGWHHWRELQELAHLAVMTRPGWKPPADGALGQLIKMNSSNDAEELRETSAGRLIFCPVTQLEISATRIRKMRRAGIGIRYLTPDSVIEKIENERIYVE